MYNIKGEITPVGKVQFLGKTNVDVTSADALRKLGIQLVHEVKDNYVFLLSATNLTGGKNGSAFAHCAIIKYKWQSIIKRIIFNHKRRRPG